MTENVENADNAFTKAQAKVAAVADNVEEVEVPKKVEEVPEEPAKNSNRKRISTDTISDTQWVKNPKLGEETGPLQIIEFFTQDGKWVKPKDGGEEFWSGLSRKDKITRIQQNVDDYVLETNKGNMSLSSWEQVGKLNTLIRHIKTLNATKIDAEKTAFEGSIINFKKVNEGSKNAGRNWILEVINLQIQIGDNNIIEELK